MLRILRVNNGLDKRRIDMQHRPFRRIAGGLLALMLSAGSVYANDLKVTDARLSILPGDRPGAGYFQLHNASDESVTLVGAESADFENVEMHVSSDEDGMASMQSVSELEVAADEQIEFAPKGYHLMFMKRKTSLSVGDEVEVTLLFDNERRLPVNFEVVSPASM